MRIQAIHSIYAGHDQFITPDHVPAKTRAFLRLQGFHAVNEIAGVIDIGSQAPGSEFAGMGGHLRGKFVQKVRIFRGRYG
ncbi:MAG: hypothetical protein FWG17_01840 [Desulfovibrionaceae bacterium]|nr:hypothetical protein [Desulfovibrionaceae bacterium]